MTRTGMSPAARWLWPLALLVGCAGPGTYVEPDPETEPYATLEGDSNLFSMARSRHRVVLLQIDGETLTEPQFLNFRTKARVRPGWRVIKARVIWPGTGGGWFWIPGRECEGTAAGMFEAGRSYRLRARGETGVELVIEAVQEK